MITAVIPTSATITNPSTEIIEKCIASVKKYFPNAPIIITCDGLRDSNRHHQANYEKFIQNLLKLEIEGEVRINAYTNHEHQSGMMIDILDDIKTENILYLEHDWELTGDIPVEKFEQIINEGTADLIRVLWPTELPAVYADKMIGEPEEINGVRLIKTFQWSQNPHIASKAFYQKVMSYFGEDDKRFIEEGIIGHVETEYRQHGWGKFKTFIFVPEGNTQRCLHLDARKGEQI